MRKWSYVEEGSGRIMTDVTERWRKQRAETRRIAAEREATESLPKCSRCLAVDLPKGGPFDSALPVQTTGRFGTKAAA
jgi:hypothetical protein